LITNLLSKSAKQNRYRPVVEKHKPIV